MVDPHRINTWTKRQVQPEKATPSAVASKTLQTFFAIDGDIRAKEDTIIVTFYNAPDANVLKEHYENLPQKLKVDFRFK